MLTQSNCISLLLMPGYALDDKQTNDLISMSIDVFIACEQQLPVTYAERLKENGVSIDEFFDIAWNVMHEFELLEIFTVN